LNDRPAKLAIEEIYGLSPELASMAKLRFLSFALEISDPGE
jgi:hypothetical protein